MCYFNVVILLPLPPVACVYELNNDGIVVHL